MTPCVLDTDVVIAALGIRLLAPDATLARNAARHRRRGISLADGFALATAEARCAGVASFASGSAAPCAPPA